MNELVEKKAHKIFMKNNTLVQAKYDLTFLQNKVFLLMLYEFQKTKSKGLKILIKRSEFKKLSSRRNDTTQSGLEKVFSDLRKKPIYFYESKNGSERWGEYGFISGYEYVKDEDSFLIKADERVYGLVQNYLDNGYTPNNLSILLNLSNYYAQRFYDLIRLWSGTKSVIEYRIDKLKEYLGLEGKYKDYSTFKRRVIKPAIKELVEKKVFKIDFEEVKEGRKIVALRFTVVDLDRRAYFKEPDVTSIEINDNKSDTEVIDKNESSIDSNAEFHIPEPGFLHSSVIKGFISNFKDVDFNDEDNKQAFIDAAMVTFYKDKVEIITPDQYGFFRTTLKNKLNDIQFKKGKEDADKIDDLEWERLK